MTAAHEALQSTITEVERLRKLLARGLSRQVYGAADLDLIKANVHTWLHTRRHILLASLDEQSLREIDGTYRSILASTNRKTSRSRYLDRLKELKRLLSGLQADKAVELSSSVPQRSSTPDMPPSFASIAVDMEMQRILVARRNECVSCVEHGLPLAATVMMGGLIEALLVARINKLSDQSPVFKAKSAPKDKTTGATLKLRDWKLSNYIDVAHEVTLISDAYKDVGEILRDYRNYIHPYKEYQHKKRITPDDSKMLWEIGKTIIRQVLKC